MAGSNPLNYSKTQRIVLLIDLHPFLHLQNPNSYLTSLLTSINKILSFPPLSLSLSSFKLFFSSLSPLLSSSSLPDIQPSLYNPNSLSFNCSDATLALLSQTLNLVSKSENFSISGSISRASHVSSSIAQVIHDYSWDSCDFYDDSDLIGIVRSNLVVLFSPVCISLKDLRDFMDVDVDDVMNEYAFCDKFKGFFWQVRDAFVSKDIHFSWVDVRYNNDIENDNQNDNLEEYGRLVGWFQNGVKSLGWGFCSSDSIVLGSAIVPFGLIYPMIGVSSTYHKLNDTCKKLFGQLNLEIVDVSGKPMGCKYCDLQLIDLKMWRGHRLDGLSLLGKYERAGAEVFQQPCGFSESFGDGIVKIDVKALHSYGEFERIDEHISCVVLVDELPIDLNKKKKDLSMDFFPDRVLNLLSEETGKFVKRKSPPFWQMLLSFLCRKGFWALLNLSNANGKVNMGVLKPFTIHSAFFFVLKDNADPQIGVQFGKSKQTLAQGILETRDKIVELDVNMDSVSLIHKNEIRRKNRKHRHSHKDLSWSSFCKAASEIKEMELEEAYSSKGCDSSKKLKFLKCWMKQAAQHNSSLPCKLKSPKVAEKVEEKLCQVLQESQQPVPILAGKHAVKEPPQIKEAGASSQEAFFSDLAQRIQHGITSGVDLLAFARRVLHSCIYWLRRQLALDIREESQTSLEKSDGSSYGGLVVGEIIKILLIDPKDLAVKHKDGNPANRSSEERVRECELQILFRMEILQSEIMASIRDSAKLKFVKQICCLLEFIQCNMDDGFFGDFNLNDYVGRTIRSRYSQKLGDIVHKIYDQMDLLLFDDDEEESPNLLLNSEDGSQSWRGGGNDRGSEPNSTDDSLHTGSIDHDRKLAEAQERRTRALRFASFTRRAMPDLQRVWAPKPPKISRSKSDSFQRSKRKHRHRESYDMVCETPASGPKKCLFPSDDSVGDEEYREQGGSSTGSIQRALFQNDETWHDDWGL